MELNFRRKKGLHLFLPSIHFHIAININYVKRREACPRMKSDSKV